MQTEVAKEVRTLKTKVRTLETQRVTMQAELDSLRPKRRRTRPGPSRASRRLRFVVSQNAWLLCRPSTRRLTLVPSLLSCYMTRTGQWCAGTWATGIVATQSVFARSLRLPAVSRRKAEWRICEPRSVATRFSDGRKYSAIWFVQVCISTLCGKSVKRVQRR